MPTGEAVETVQLTLNTIRGLSMDAVQAANSGHPGLPMGAAAMGYALFARHLRFDPEAPDWFNRDRFILSAGHGSMLLYSLLFLTGYDLSLDDIKNFRQWGSKTPGHPENFMAPGVEMATGPLGQGFATGVGMAIAEEMLRAAFPDDVGHWTYAICSDGDLMEGVSHEAASLAGHLQLGRLVYLYDSNRVTIDGKTDLAYSDDVAGRFAAYGWHVSKCDGMDVDQVDQRIAGAKGDARPSLIVCTTTIGYGSPNKADSEQSHGSPLGVEEVKSAKIALGIPLEPLFFVPGEVREHMLEVGSRCRKERIASENKIDEALKKRLAGEMDHSWERHLPVFEGAMATRASSGKIINAIAKGAPQLVGGSADLTDSNQTEIIGGDTFSARSRMGRNIHFGVREHAMACAVNGLNLHGGLRAFGGTFLIFSDYMRPPIRLAALMRSGSIFVFTHDSIGLGEDGPTHQPIEHLMGLRAIPNLAVFRPADANETAAAWKIALERNEGPTALVLTRQPVPPLSLGIEGGLRGGYVLRESSTDPSLMLIATGSEVSICVEAREMLESEGIPTRVVSIPCWELFGEQPQEYRDSVLPPSVTARVSVEAGATLGWDRWIGSYGKAIGLDHFGASAPYKRIYEEFGLTPEKIADAARSLV
ncbi:MAG: transketolase [Armatimonadetes bacterium]|nr:transketolase [Armatimonadota bacterium]